MKASPSITPNRAMMILGMGLVTCLPRWLPLWVAVWLDLIPVAILSALLAPLPLTTALGPHLDLGRSELWAAIKTFGVATWTRSLGGAGLAGMIVFWLIRLYGP